MGLITKSKTNETASTEFKAKGVVEIVEWPVDSIVFREDLYPRVKPNHETVQKYSEDLDVLPPIEANKRRELVDGRHRWMAHQKAGATTIRVIVTETANDGELLEAAIERNSTHGLQLSQEDKRNMARRIYSVTLEREREAKKAHLAKILSVSERTVREWLSRIDKDSREARDRRIFELWLACYSQEEIAEAVGCTRDIVRGVKELKLGESGNIAEFPKNVQASASHADFDPPLYNVFREREKTAETNYVGTTETRFLDNLLFLYTAPFDIVVDVFAGSGSTIDVCQKRFRRYWVSDRKPVIERPNEIRQWDMTNGIPSLPRWKDVRLVYLDPPSWKQSEGQYSNDPSDLANMPLDQFTKTLAGIINEFGKKLSNGAYIALVMQPTQWNAPEHRFTDHVGDMLRAVNLPVDMRFSAPFEFQQCTPPMVEWAKANRKCLVLTCEIIVWRIDRNVQSGTPRPNDEMRKAADDKQPQ